MHFLIKSTAICEADGIKLLIDFFGNDLIASSQGGMSGQSSFVGEPHT